MMSQPQAEPRLLARCLLFKHRHAFPARTSSPQLSSTLILPSPSHLAPSSLNVIPSPTLPLTPQIPIPEPIFEFLPEAEEHAWKHLVIHHTATASGDVELIHQMHLQRKDSSGVPWKGIGYHFLIGNGQGMDDGQIEATFRWNEQISGAHAGVGQFNRDGIGICLVGNFELTDPTPAQIRNLIRLIEMLSDRYEIPADQIIGHQDVKATACPGKNFPWKTLREAFPKPASASKSD